MLWHVLPLRSSHRANFPRTKCIINFEADPYLEDKDTPEETARWGPFYDRMRSTVIPNTASLIADCRARGVEDCCAAATMELHHHELEIISMIYCHVVQLDEVLGFFTA